MTYGDFKDLTRTIVSDKILRDKATNIAKNLKYDGYQDGLPSMVYKFFDKVTSGGALKNEIIQNKELAEELHKAIIRKLETRKVLPSFIDTDMQLISKFNEGTRFLLYVIDIFSKYVWVTHLKEQKGITTSAFQEFLDESNRKSNKILVDKNSKF